MVNENKIQEMQILEQNLQNILLQKQAFQMELSETESALNEIERAGEDVFKIIGQLMIKTDKSKVKDELLNKKKIIDIRVKTLQKQEVALSNKIEEIREEIMKSVNKKEK
jgi:prefoldin beta subunit